MTDALISEYPTLLDHAVLMGHLVLETGRRLPSSLDDLMSDEDIALASLVGAFIDSNDPDSTTKINVLRQGLKLGMREEDAGIRHIGVAA